MLKQSPIFHWNVRKKLLLWGWLGQVTQRAYGVSILGDTQKPTEHSPKQCFKLTMLWAGGWTRWPPAVSSNLNHSVIMWILHYMNTQIKSTLICFLGAGTFPSELSLQQRQAETSNLIEVIYIYSTALLRDISAWVLFHSKRKSAELRMGFSRNRK